MVSKVEFYYHKKQGNRLEDQEKRESLQVERVNAHEDTIDVVIMVITKSLANDQSHCKTFPHNWSISEIHWDYLHDSFFWLML